MSQPLLLILTLWAVLVVLWPSKGDRGITFPAMDMKTFRELVTFPPAQSPFDPDHLLIDSGSDISLVWNENIFTCMEPCILKQCTSVGSTPLSV